MQVEQEIVLKGSPICRGIAIGKPFFLNRDHFPVFEMPIPSAHMQREIQRYREALSRSKQDIKRLQKQLEIESAAEGILILEAQLEMLQDPLLTSEIESEIKKSKKNVEFIFQQTLCKYQERFQSINDPFFAERFQDLQDLSRRIFGYLNKNGNASLSEVPPGSIICTHELTASDAASANISFINAFITETGGVNSHAVIVAKAKGIPCVTDISLAQLKEHRLDMMIVDGRTGYVFLNPSKETLAEYEQHKHDMQNQIKILEKQTKWPPQTYDGYSIRLCANLNATNEIDLIHEHGGEGIGLFRSEYIFLPDHTIPDEEKQFQIYRTIAEGMKGLPVAIRTFDIGGDKSISSSTLNTQDTFFSGRQARLMIKDQALFKTQLRAILRASEHGNVSILFPMISTLSELREAKRMVHEVRQELQLSQVVRIGCMIEVPSAAMVADHFAGECDFLSIGTNDLVQYAFAIERSEQTLHGCYDPTDPSIIRMIKCVTSEANKAHIPVSICGEIASDPRFTGLLLGLGIQELSVAPRHLPIIKNAIRRTNIVEAVHLAEKVLEAAHSHDVLEIIVNDYRKKFPEDLFYK